MTVKKKRAAPSKELAAGPLSITLSDPMKRRLEGLCRTLKTKETHARTGGCGGRYRGHRTGRLPARLPDSIWSDLQTRHQNIVKNSAFLYCNPKTTGVISSPYRSLIATETLKTFCDSGKPPSEYGQSVDCQRPRVIKPLGVFCFRLQNPQRAIPLNCVTSARKQRSGSRGCLPVESLSAGNVQHDDNPEPRCAESSYGDSVRSKLPPTVLSRISTRNFRTQGNRETKLKSTFEIQGKLVHCLESRETVLK